MSQLIVDAAVYINRVEYNGLVKYKPTNESTIFRLCISHLSAHYLSLNTGAVLHIFATW